MAEASLHERSEGELSDFSTRGENVERDFTSSPSMVNTVKNKRKKRKSKYEILDDKYGHKFNQLNDKLDNIVSMFSSINGEKEKPNSSANEERNSTSAKEVNNNRHHNRDSCSSSEDDDRVSLHPKEGELFHSDCEIITPGSQMTKEPGLLYEIFGDDAVTKKPEAKSGISIDSSQREVLNTNWRTQDPNSVTAFAEENMEHFPVDEETQAELKVPTLDEIVETCLTKKYGAKASFSKNGKNLFHQPYKMIEKTAYRGQQAAYMGIVMNMYLQQGLGSLVQMLQDKDYEKAMQQVRDVFAISTKTLDQFGRTGALHHIIRRQLTMTDTSLYELEDAKSVSRLPLTSDGVFGKELETTLKAKKEKKKALDDLIPSLNKKDSLKRKSSYQGKEASAPKRQYVQPNYTGANPSNNMGNYVIPKTITETSTSRYPQKRVYNNKPQLDNRQSQYKPMFNKKASNSSFRGGKTGQK